MHTPSLRSDLINCDSGSGNSQKVLEFHVVIFLSQREAAFRNSGMHVLLFIYTFSIAQAGSLSLSEYYRLLEQKNLPTKIQSLKIEAASEASKGVFIPPPMLGIIQSKDGSGTSQGFELSQEIPFPGKFTADHEARKLEVEEETENAHSLRKEIMAKARYQYFGLWYAQETENLLIAKKNSIVQHLKIASAWVQADIIYKVHLLKAESDLDLLENEILRAALNIREKQIQLTQDIAVDPTAFFPVAEPLEVTVSYLKENSFRISQIIAKEKTVAKLAARENEARAQIFPDFFLRYKKMGATPMTPGSSEMMLGVTLPFAFFWEANAAKGKATAERMQGEVELEMEKNRILSKREVLVSRAESLLKQIANFQERIIPRAEKQMRLVHSIVPKDMDSLQSHREVMEALPELKMKALEIRAQYEEVVMELSQYAPEAFQ